MNIARRAPKPLVSAAVRGEADGTMVDGQRHRNAGRGGAHAALRDVEGGRGIVQHRDRHAVRRIDYDPRLRRNAYQRHGKSSFELGAQPGLLRYRTACEFRNANKDDAGQRGQRTGNVQVGIRMGWNPRILHAAVPQRLHVAAGST